MARCTTSSTGALARDRREAVEDHQQLEMARLDALQVALWVALWDQAMAGDVDAAREVHAIIVTRRRLLGLHERSKQPAARTPRTVVLSEADREVLGV